MDQRKVDQQPQSIFNNVKLQIKESREMLNNLNSNKNLNKEFINRLSDSINYSIQRLENFVNGKIYVYIFNKQIFFMGMISAGKSTLINCLLGQQLMPFKNRECTQNFLFISHSKQITIDNIQVEDLQEAQKKLKQLQMERKNSNIKISVNSQFHNELPEMFREKIIFVDCPGFNVMKLQDQIKLFEEFEKNENLRIYDRINIWVGNYMNFEIEIPSTKQYLEQLKLVKVQNQNKVENCIISQIFEQRKLFFYVSNKFDAREEDDGSLQDQKIQLREIINIDQSHYIFYVSAEKALAYNILNGGNLQAKELFYQTFFTNNRMNFNFQSTEDCSTFCDKNFKNNTGIIQDQEINLFVNELQTSILVDWAQFYEKISSILGFYFKFIICIGKHDLISIPAEQFQNYQQLKQKIIPDLVKNFTTQVETNSYETIMKIQIIITEGKLQLKENKLETIQTVQEKLIITLSDFLEKIKIENKNIQVEIERNLTIIFQKNLSDWTETQKQFFGLFIKDCDDCISQLSQQSIRNQINTFKLDSFSYFRAIFGYDTLLTVSAGAGKGIYEINKNPALREAVLKFIQFGEGAWPYLKNLLNVALTAATEGVTLYVSSAVIVGGMLFKAWDVRKQKKNFINKNKLIIQKQLEVQVCLLNLRLILTHSRHLSPLNPKK